MTLLKFMTKRIMLGGGILLLLLAAFLAGGIFLHSAQASSNAANATKTGQSGNFIKGGFHVLSVQGQDIQAVVQGANSDVLKNNAAITIHMSASTKYMRDGKVVPSVTIVPGSEIAAYGTLKSDGSLDAQGIAVGDLTGGHKSGRDQCANPQAATFSGTISAISGTTLTVVDGMNGYRYSPTCNNFELGAPLTFTITTDASTRFVQDKSSTISLSDLKVGAEVSVQGTRVNGDTVKASLIQVIPSYVIGKIVNISGTTITLEGNITVQTSANTKVLNKAHPDTFGFADLKAGDTIFATGTKGSDGVLTATNVFYLAPYPQK